MSVIWMVEKPLLALAMDYFRRLGYRLEGKVALMGMSGLFQTFDILLEKSGEVRLACVKDWTRSVGVNMIIKIDNASDDVGLRRPFFIAKSFSSHAYAYSHRHGVTLLTPKDLSSRICCAEKA